MYSTQMRRPQSSSLPVWGSITVIAAVAIGIGWGAVAAYNWASSYTISTGMRHGIVQKFSYKGPWASCSSYEGELVLIGLRSKTVTSPQGTGRRRGGTHQHLGVLHRRQGHRSADRRCGLHRLAGHAPLQAVPPAWLLLHGHNVPYLQGDS